MIDSLGGNQSVGGVFLKQMTVRVPIKIEKMIKREAERKGLSLNKATISLLEDAFVKANVPTAKKRISDHPFYNMRSSKKKTVCGVLADLRKARYRAI